MFPFIARLSLLLRLWSVRLHLRREAFVKLKVFPNDKAVLRPSIWEIWIGGGLFILNDWDGCYFKNCFQCANKIELYIILELLVADFVINQNVWRLLRGCIDAEKRSVVKCTACYLRAMSIA